MKKLLISFVASLAVFVFVAQLVTPASAQAQTSFCYTFNNNLGVGRSISSADAQALATALSNAGLWNANTPITSYTDAVASAVSGFQEKYASQILAPYGLSYGTGYVGASTRAELNSLYGCSSGSTTTTTTSSTQCPSSFICTPVNKPTTPVCPAGYVCKPVTTSPIQPTGSKGATWATIMSASSVIVGSQFSISGNTSITSGNLTIVVAGPNYTGVTDWNTVGNLLKSSTMLVGGYAQIQGLANAQSYQYWSAQFGGIQTPGSYTVLVYDSSGDLLTTGTITIGSSTNSNESITVTNPQAGGVFDNSGGKPNIATITWTSTGLGNNPVGINLLSSNGTLVKNVVASIPNTGSYAWTYDPTVSNGTYAIQVYIAGKGDAVGTSGYFQIINSQAPSGQKGTGWPTYQATSPDGSVSFSFQYPTGISILNSVSISNVTAHINQTGSSIDSNGCYINPLFSGRAGIGDSQTTINGISFCASNVGDPGAGTVTTDYYYTTHADGWYITLDYPVGSITCGALEGGSGYQSCLNSMASSTLGIMSVIQQSLQTFQMEAKG